MRAIIFVIIACVTGYNAVALGDETVVTGDIAKKLKSIDRARQSSALVSFVARTATRSKSPSKTAIVLNGQIIYKKTDYGMLMISKPHKSSLPLPAGFAVIGHSKPSVVIVNDRYAAVLEGSKDEAGWILTDIHKFGADKYIELAQKLQQYGILALDGVNSIRLIDGSARLSELFDLNGFQVQSINLTKSDGHVNIFSQRVHRTNSLAVVKSHYILNSPAECLPISWSETSESPDINTQSKLQVNRNYTQVSADAVQFGTKITRYGAGANNVSSTTETDFALHYNTITPDYEFALPAYGIPEPPGFEAPRTPLYIWLLIGAAVLFVLAVGFRFLARRRRAARA